MTTAHYEYVLRDGDKELTFRARTAAGLARLVNDRTWSVDFASSFTKLVLTPADDDEDRTAPAAYPPTVRHASPAND